MSQPVNLNRYRKAKARAEAKTRANENAVKYGRTGAQKKLDRAEADKAQRDLDGHEREQ